MELLVVFAFFVALMLLAARFGADSRDYVPSDEERLAALGFTWERPVPTTVGSQHGSPLPSWLAERRLEADLDRLAELARGAPRRAA
jgi:hypothetical protein